MFLWCHVRLNNPLREPPGRIKNVDKEIAKKFNYDGIEFPLKEKDFDKIETKTIFVLMCLVMKMGWFFQFTFRVKNMKTQWICCF